MKFSYRITDVKPGENIIQFVDAVIDSSRYYVVRIKDPKSSRTTMLGVGFREREDAFDLKNCLNDYVKFISRMDLASQLAAAPLTNDFSSMHLSSEGASPFGEVDHPDDEAADGTEVSAGYKLGASGPAKVSQCILHYLYLPVADILFFFLGGWRCCRLEPHPGPEGGRKDQNFADQKDPPK